MLGTAREQRERQRQRRLRRLAAVLALPALWMWWRILTGRNPWPQMPAISDDLVFWLPGILIVLLLGVVLVAPFLANNRSPHVVIAPEQIDVTFADVRGLGRVLEEVRHTLRVLLDHQTFREQMGGRPRRGILFEGPPGTGKTHVAKAMAAEAGVPFLFVSATAFQSMWYGMTAKRIRRFFKELRRIARAEGGVIGFIEEIDAIGLRRPGTAPGSPATSAGRFAGRSIAPAMSADTGGVVNELLVQMQSFDDPPLGLKIRGRLAEIVNRYLPDDRRIRLKPAPYANVLLIAATNRAAALDPALLRPGRFDRILHFDRPGKTGRRELIDLFLARKAHDPELDTDATRDELAAQTLGYTPAQLERLFDEALLLALRDGRQALTDLDLRRARMEIEIGLPEPVDSPEDERRTIATHEAGHATVAYLVGVGRTLEMLSIIKRKEALGFLAHRMSEERHTQRRTELEASLQISMGGLAAEEVFFGEASTGPGGDLVAATRVAAEMVGSFGMGGTLISFRASDAGPLSGDLVQRVISDREGRRAVERLLEDAKAEAIRLVSAHRHVVEALRDALLAREELVEHEIIEVIEDALRRPPTDTGLIIDLTDEDARRPR